MINHYHVIILVPGFSKEGRSMTDSFLLRDTLPPKTDPPYVATYHNIFHDIPKVHFWLFEDFQVSMDHREGVIPVWMYLFTEIAKDLSGHGRCSVYFYGGDSHKTYAFHMSFSFIYRHKLPKWLPFIHVLVQKSFKNCSKWFNSFHYYCGIIDLKFYIWKNVACEVVI